MRRAAEIHLLSTTIQKLLVEQAIRLLSLASRAAARGEFRSAAGRRIACPTCNACTKYTVS
jgi:hypothetical protein